MTFLYKADPQRGERWAELFAEKAPDIDFHIWPGKADPDKVRYLGVWEPPDRIAERFPNLEVLFSVAAGVDKIDFSALPAGLPVVRMIEPGIVAGMVEYVLWAVLGLHRDMPTYRRFQEERLWKPLSLSPAGGRRVGVLGLGELGRAVLRQLRTLGFQTFGWSRAPHVIEGTMCFGGRDHLPDFLAHCDILVCLLPLTTETTGLLDKNMLACLPRGAALVQVGRGPHLVAEDLLSALDSGQIRDAILDVTEPEPLPPSDPLWVHPRVTLTPHIASMTQPDSAVDVVLENIRRFHAGEPMIGLVDKAKGY
ncbi:MAG: glyoxylate/hydroxypyruvate reductase A [Burkholderiaceae bacterium]|nr:glyoxylate/hydroxypyruvate reductase A [Burkholderiaceae bacterium]